MRTPPRKQLRLIMTYVAERTARDGYRGCLFINFCAEFSDPWHPGRQVAAATMQAMWNRLHHLAQSLGASQAKRLADAWLLLLEGAYALSQTLGGGESAVAHTLPSASEMLLDAHLSSAAASASARRAASQRRERSRT